MADIVAAHMAIEVTGTSPLDESQIVYLADKLVGGNTVANLRQRFAELELPAWFMPYVNVQRPGQPCNGDSAFCGESGIIQAGDVLKKIVEASTLEAEEA